MALFHQPGFERQPAFPPQGYYHQPQSYQVGYQLPPPMIYHDPSSFRRDYAARLSELTMNSRPIIQNLSMIAQDYTRYSDIVAQCLEAHIRRVPPWMKLPAFYVLDAISKNVYDPYAAKFAPFVAPLFLETYRQIDPSTRSKMEEMLVTWRTGAPSGKELFGVAPQIAIERSIWSNDPTPSVADSSSRRGEPQPTVTKSQVLAELEVTLAQKERAVNLNPYDTNTKSQVSVLHQLRRLVEQGVSQDELAQILQQLRTMGREAVPPPTQLPVSVAPPAVPPSLIGSTSGFLQGRPSPQQVIPQPTIPPASFRGFNPPPPTQPMSLAQYGGPHVSQIPVASSSSGPAPVASNISDLFKSLVKAGLVSASSTPTGAGSSTQETISDVKGTPEPTDVGLESSRDYAKKVLGMKIRLNTSDIAKQKPQFISSLYDNLPVQCKQCAARFIDGSVGKKKYQDHLDMHFRQNQRANHASGRGHSRSWFISIEDFISDVSRSDTKGKGRAVGESDRIASSSEDAAQREAELRASFIVVPAGDEAKLILCPVCKESIKSEFVEDDEEWVWRNAVKVKEKIFHATCHAEMIASSTLAAKLRMEATNSSSRSATPDLMDARPTTPPKGTSTIKPSLSAEMKAKLRASRSPTPDRLLGMKRKAEDNRGIAAGAEGDTLPGTPPLKKMAMTTVAAAS